MQAMIRLVFNILTQRVNNRSSEGSQVTVVSLRKTGMQEVRFIPAFLVSLAKDAEPVVMAMSDELSRPWRRA